MNRGGSGTTSEEGEGLMSGGVGGAVGQIRGLVGRWPDADAVLQGGMSEGLRDWDLWYGHTKTVRAVCDGLLTHILGDHYSSACYSPSS